MLLSTKDDLKTVSFICNPAGNNAYLLSKNCRLLELKLGNLQRRSHRILDQAEDLLVDSEIFEKNKVPENSFACHDGESLFIYIHTDSSLENFNKNLTFKVVFFTKWLQLFDS